MNSAEHLRNFQEMHIDIVWDELRLRFGFDVSAWKKEFREFLASQPRNTAEPDAFIVFGNRRINPVLNSILRRNELFPTFNKLVAYILTRGSNKNHVLSQTKPRDPGKP